MAKQTGVQDNLLDRVIANITEDQKALEEQNDLIEKAKTYKREIVDRIKGLKHDLSTFVKYATEEQKKQIDELGLDVSESSGRGVLNPFSQIVLDTLTETKGNKMTNGDLYSAYVDSVTEGEAEDYTQFNIKIRQLFNSGRISKKQIDPVKSNRDDIISLNVDVKN